MKRPSTNVAHWLVAILTGGLLYLSGASLPEIIAKVLPAAPGVSLDQQ